ncbi:MAG: hypothetical protein AAGH79_06170 [Bacteroidota bacterium]
MVLIVLIAMLGSSCEYWFRKERVGAIYYDPNTDRSDFQPCAADQITEYYRSLPQYKEGLRDLTSHFLRKTPMLSDTLSGYFTARFIVNCEGAHGWYRFRATDLQYQSIPFDPHVQTWMLERCQSLDNWAPGQRERKVVDSYVLITVRIENGTIKSILP